MRAMPALRGVSVVMLPPLGAATDGAETAGVGSSQGAQDTSGLERTAFGFVAFAGYTMQCLANRLTEECMDIARMSVALVNKLEAIPAPFDVTVRKLVDVDCCRLQDGEYRLRRRNAP